MTFTVIVVESPGEERKAGTWPTRKQADAQAQALRRIERRDLAPAVPFPKVLVDEESKRPGISTGPNYKPGG